MNHASRIPVRFLLLAVFAAASVAWAGQESRWTAGATQGDIRMQAEYLEDFNGDTVDQRLQVQLDNASLNTMFFISLNDRVIGRLVTDDNGHGEFVKVILGAEAGPDGRPVGDRINTGDRITVFRGIHSGTGTFVQD